MTARTSFGRRWDRLNSYLCQKLAIDFRNVPFPGSSDCAMYDWLNTGIWIEHRSSRLFFWFVDAAHVLRCGTHWFCFCNTGKETIRRVRLLYGAQQHNWPHFKTFVILISIGDASQIWYRWKALGEAHQESFPFRERRWHIWITSCSQSASADWLSDSNGRSLWPISAAYGAAATTVSTVSTVILRLTAAFLGGVSFRLTCNSATMKKRSEFASWWFRHDLPTLYRFFFLFYLLSFASLAFSMEELESLIVIIITHSQSQLRQLAWLLHVVHGENGRIWRID